MAKIYQLSEARDRRLKLGQLREMLGEVFHRAVIPLFEIPAADLDYILPSFLIRYIDDLTLGELDDLIQGRLKFFIIK